MFWSAGYLCCHNQLSGCALLSRSGRNVHITLDEIKGKFSLRIHKCPHFQNWALLTENGKKLFYNLILELLRRILHQECQNMKIQVWIVPVCNGTNGRTSTLLMQHIGSLLTMNTCATEEKNSSRDKEKKTLKLHFSLKCEKRFSAEILLNFMSI